MALFFTVVEGEIVLVDESGNPVGVVLDGADYRLQTEAKVSNFPAVQPVSDNGSSLTVDATAWPLPTGAATEATLSSINGKVATEATLAALNVNAADIETILGDIRDTAGVKKITDQLPAGTNEIGKVAQGTKGAGSNAWPQVLYDASGNPVAVVLDNSIYRLETRSTLVGQIAGTGAETKVTVITDTESATEKRLQTEARLAPGSTVNIGTGIPSNPADLVLDFLEKSGGGESLLVDGSTTPVQFVYAPPAGKSVAVQEVLIVFAADDFEFDGASFGPNAAMTNGVKVETYIDSVLTEIFTVKQNEDFLRVPGRPPIVNNTGPKDILAASLSFGGLVKLHDADGDELRVTVQDNLTSVKFKYFTATLYGVEE